MHVNVNNNMIVVLLYVFVVYYYYGAVLRDFIQYVYEEFARLARD